MNNNTLFLTDDQVALRYGVNRASIWRWLKTDPTFPKPHRFSRGCTRWSLDELLLWQRSRKIT